MGTRGGFGFRKDGKDFIKYNQFDSYPGGRGLEFIEALKENRGRLAEVVDNWVPLEAFASALPDPEPDWESDGAGVGPFMDETSRKRMADGYGEGSDFDLLKRALPDISRSVEFKELFRPTPVLFKNYADFLAESLFCEYAYVANLDDGTLEFYVGFNKDPKAPGRYAALSEKGRETPSEYFGVGLAGTLPLEAALNAEPGLVAKALEVLETRYEMARGRLDDDEKEEYAKRLEGPMGGGAAWLASLEEEPEISKASAPGRKALGKGI